MRTTLPLVSQQALPGRTSRPAPGAFDPPTPLMNAIRRFRSASLFILFFALSGVASAQSGRVVGTVTEDGGRTLPGANVFVAGTTIGAATDVNGRFTIANAPAGPQTIVASFVGFQSDSVQVVVPAGGEIEVDLSLAFGQVGQEVEITGQALGQQTAINEQLNAETISNIVSADRIRELPDENAAAAVSRLPGVSLQNGDQIVVRGIEAKYNTVTVNGVQLPSTGTDRSTSLGFISSNMLAGIEVSKSVTPAMEANSIGGNVNLRLQEAPEGLHYDAMVQGDYNDQDKTADNYRTWASISNRFFGDRLGAFVQGNARRFNGGGDIANFTYVPLPEGDVGGGLRPYYILDATFQDEVNTVNEYGASLLLDYRLPAGKIILQNAYSSEDYDNTFLTDQLLLETGRRNFGINRNGGTNYLLVNSLQGEHQLPVFSVDWVLSHSRSNQDQDFGYTTTFGGTGYFTGLQQSVDDQDTVYDLQFDDAEAVPGIIGDGQTFYEGRNERRLSAGLNVKVPVTLGFITGRIQGGGKYTDLDRDRDRLVYYRRLADGDAQNAGASDYLRDVVGVDPVNPLPLSAFRDGVYQNERGQYFLDERRAYSGALNVDYLDNYFRLAQDGWPTAALAQSNRDDYTAQESIGAGYIMGNFDFGSYLNLLGGVRYEKFSFNNSAPLVLQTLYDGQGEVRDTLSVERSFGDWFPNIQAKISPTDWVDVRLAYTKTTSRPDYQALLVSTWVGDSGDGVSGNPNLRPTISDNFDAYISFSNSKIGLFTVGAFAKNLSNVIRTVGVQRQALGGFNGLFWAADTSAATRAITGYQVCSGETATSPDDQRLYSSCDENGLATGFRVPNVRRTGLISTSVNNPDNATLSGFEVDWQTNFWYLPGILQSVVFNANYTKITSSIDYQSVFYTRNPECKSPLCSLPQVQVDTVRTGRLFRQGDDIINLALGADIGGFSGRLSFRYQGDVASSIAARDPANDTFEQPVTGWDLSLRQRLPIEGLSVFFNGVNLSHSRTDSGFSRVLGADATAAAFVPTRVAYYPRRFQFGIRFGR